MTDPLAKAQLVLDEGRRCDAVSRPSPPVGLQVVKSAVVRAGRDAPSPLVARLLRRKSDLPLRILTLLMITDPSLVDAGLLNPGALRAQLGISAGRGNGQDGPDGYKIMNRALHIFEEEHHAWLTETRAWVKPRTFAKGISARASPSVFKPNPRLWTHGWYLGATKEELAWVLARMALGPSFAASARAPRLDFNRNVHGIQATQCWETTDPWTAQALAILERSPVTSSAQTLLQLSKNERLLRVFWARSVLKRHIGDVVHARGIAPSTTMRPAFLTDRRLSVAATSRTMSSADYIDIPRDRVHTVAADDTHEYLKIFVRDGGRQQVALAATEAGEATALARHIVADWRLSERGPAPGGLITN